MPEELESAGVPREVAEGLATLRESLRAAAGANLHALVLYGGVARGRFRPGHSDVNVAVVLDDAGVNSLEAIAPALQAAWRSIRVEPMVLRHDEIAAAAEAFPTKFLDIRDHSQLLSGEDLFVALDVPAEQVRLRIEQALRNLAMRLRRRFVSIAGSPSEMRIALESAARPFAIELNALLEVAGKPTPTVDRTATIFDAAAEAFGLTASPLAQLARLRQDGGTDLDPKVLYGQVLGAIDAAIARTRGLKESAP